MVIQTDAWAAAAWGVFRQLCNATVTVYTEGEKTYNADTGHYDDPAETVVYTGEARVQPIHAPERELIAGKDTNAQFFRVQIPRNSAVLNDKMFMRVDQGGLDGRAGDFKYHVATAFNASGSFEQSFLVTANADGR